MGRPSLCSAAPFELACGGARGLRGADVFRGGTGNGVWVFFPGLSVVRAAVEPGVKTALNGWVKPGEKGAGRGGGYRAPAAWAGGSAYKRARTRKSSAGQSRPLFPTGGGGVLRALRGASGSRYLCPCLLASAFTCSVLVDF